MVLGKRENNDRAGMKWEKGEGHCEPAHKPLAGGTERKDMLMWLQGNTIVGYICFLL